MPAATDIQAHLDACRSILNISHDPAARIWNHELRRSHRRLLLLAADLPTELSSERWESLPAAYRQQIKAVPERFAAWAARMNSDGGAVQ